jgi:hypothetical membrane protein
MSQIAEVSDARRSSSSSTVEEQIAARRRHELKSDLLYIVGAVLVVVGIAMRPGGYPHAAMAAGAFCLLFPCSEFLMSFIRGLRPQKSR